MLAYDYIGFRISLQQFEQTILGAILLIDFNKLTWPKVHVSSAR